MFIWHLQAERTMGNPSLGYLAANFTRYCAKNPSPCARVGVGV